MDEQERARRKRQLEQHRLRLAILEEEAALEGDVGSTEVGTASEVANESVTNFFFDRTLIELESQLGPSDDDGNESATHFFFWSLASKNLNRN
jgi:hypothetical protein